MPESTNVNRKISIAPMMDWTDRHDRYFLRQISNQCLLYTEMVTTGAVIHGDRDKLLAFDQAEHPIAVQLGGSDPKELAQSTDVCTEYGYDEINLNVGCPSDRVQRGKIGACLMAEPETVAACVSAMQAVTDRPVTVKCRTGIDELDQYEHLQQFVEQVANAGCKTFIIHARKAWLSGLSPKQNREVPPLHYDRVYRIKEEYPELEIIINGGITELSQIDEHLKYTDGVMIGREAYQNPYFLAEMDARYLGVSHSPLSRIDVVKKMLPYVEAHLANGGKLHQITRHMLGLFHAQPRGRLWRRHLSENAPGADATIQVLLDALSIMENKAD
ncbi:tRNA dihydrouridine(20/20a) synthase DusA [Pleionea litopenaei]|uniref:tRNA-dihydrouridine(20/20a) synthase n=1 Tax=Pleionea litopenaei TaxID=3070815 RepID=A0AA51RWF0_9GAMM|nr:tRNA dihydrouridine(20/20a) synthase DusA [Pleionea sp. HL-JVS1]WMS88709.1 tRNA dihydrouridine(20/20a) synthase DusA [Pleionea sp. HL-JVS1]